MTAINMLWVKGPLSRLARLSHASFVQRGFEVVVWSYDRATNTRDAAEITPYTEDIAVLSNQFRYNLLATLGGIWSDMDVVALAGPEALPRGAFVASEKRRPFRHKEASATGEGLTQVTNCFMGNPSPRNGDLWHQAASAVHNQNPEERRWESVGPHLLSELMLRQPGHGVEILPPEAVDPVAWWNVPGYFLEDRPPPPSPFMHMYASIWKRRGVDENQPFPPDSLAGRLWKSVAL
jgi:Glycosyltransferase sugar-binding region containing DXD motif